MDKCWTIIIVFSIVAHRCKCFWSCLLCEHDLILFSFLLHHPNARIRFIIWVSGKNGYYTTCCVFNKKWWAREQQSTRNCEICFPWERSHVEHLVVVSCIYKILFYMVSNVAKTLAETLSRKRNTVTMHAKFSTALFIWASQMTTVLRCTDQPQIVLFMLIKIQNKMCWWKSCLGVEDVSRKFFFYALKVS